MFDWLLLVGQYRSLLMKLRKNVYGTNNKKYSSNIIKVSFKECELLLNMNFFHCNSFN